MYQLEVKHWLIAYRFPPIDGWQVTVDIDAMELAKGGQHTPDKADRAKAAEASLHALGVTIGAHPLFGRADVVAEHPSKGCYVIEVEGKSSKQKEQALYSALGQLVIQMQGKPISFVLAAPNEPAWQAQVKKIPAHARNLLNLSCVLVSADGVVDA
jgi:hypothetical protein